MRRLLAFLLTAIAPLALLSATAHADTLRLFSLSLPNATIQNISGNSPGADVLDGSLIVDTTTGLVESASVFTDAGPLLFTASTITRQGVLGDDPGSAGGCSICSFGYTPGYYSVSLADTTASAYFTLNFASASLVDYQGSAICSPACTLSGRTPQPFRDGTLLLSATASVYSGNAVFQSDLSDPGVPYLGTPGNGLDPFGVGHHPPAVTPEPSTLCLLGSGLLGLAGTLRRHRRG